MSDGRVGLAGPAIAVTAAAAAWFATGAWFTLEWTDEGWLAYASWQVAEGAFPHRDFHDIYGPAYHLVSGSLLRLFGSELVVLRWAIALVKAVTVGLVFGVAWRVVSPRLALGAGVFLTGVWGAPWALFWTPYASHYAFAFGLLGATLVLAARARPRQVFFAAGLCVGIAATFKQTTGLLFHLALLATLLAERPSNPVGSRPAPRWLARLARPLAWAALLVFALILPLLPDGRGGTSHALLLGGPLALWAGWELLRELRDPPPDDVRAESLVRMLVLSGGALLPLALCALVYLAAGGLPQLIDDTLLSLPRAIAFFVPLSLDPLALLPYAMVLAVLGCARRADVRASRAWRAAALVLAVLLPAVLLAVGGWGTSGSAPGRLALSSVALLPVLVAWAAPFLLSPSLRQRSGRAGLLAAALATTGLLGVHPVADLHHLLLALPVFLPAAAALLALALPTTSGSPEGSWDRRVALGASALVLVILLWPFVKAVPDAYARTRPLEGVARAEGIRRGPVPRQEVATLLRELEAPGRRDRALFVPSGEPMVHFLSGRPSLFPRYEYLVYLAGFGLLPDEELERRLDEDQMLSVLAAERPVLVEDRERSVHLRRALPRLAAHLDAHYREARRIGRFHVLAPEERAGP